MLQNHEVREKLPEPVYYVKSPTDATVLVAIDVAVINRRWVTWFDTVKERGMEAAVILDNYPRHFSFRRTEGEGGHSYTFVPMSLDIYNTLVKERLLHGQDFSDQEAMIQAFLQTQKEAW